MKANLVPGNSPARTESGDNIENLNLAANAQQSLGRLEPAASAHGSQSQRSRSSQDNPARPILLKRDEVCRLLGNISPRTVARMEQRGLIRPVRILRHKLYSRAALEALVNNDLNWEA